MAVHTLCPNPCDLGYVSHYRYSITGGAHSVHLCFFHAEHCKFARGSNSGHRLTTRIVHLAFTLGVNMPQNWWTFKKIPSRGIVGDREPLYHHDNARRVMRPWPWLAGVIHAF